MAAGVACDLCPEPAGYRDATGCPEPQTPSRASGQRRVTITPDPTQATAILTILNEGSGRRTVAADRLDIKREHFVAYSAAYELKLVNGKVLIPTEGISANRMLLFDENRVLGFENAQESMVDTMVDDLAWQIVRRLQAVKP
jgi:LPS-assembly lipoprotein